MSKGILIAVLIIVVALIIGIIIFAYIGYNTASKVLGSPTATEDRTVKQFDKIQLEGMGTLKITQGAQESLRVEAPENLISAIRTEVSFNTLKIDYRRKWLFFSYPFSDVTFHVTVKDLSKIETSGSANIMMQELFTEKLTLETSGSAEGNININVGAFDFESSGSSTLNVSGRADTQRIKISGSGEYKAKDFKTNETDIDISGSGDALVNVKERLNVNISGSGSVEYYGNPSKVDQDISGSGTLRKK